MKKIQLTKNNFSVEILIDKLKIIKGSNYKFQFELMQILKSALSGKQSEYQTCYKKPYVSVDNKELRVKPEQIFYVNPHFDLEDDMKMGVKSLSYRYFSSILSSELLYDTFNTLDVIIEGIKSEVNIVEDSLKIDTMECNQNNIIKMIKPIIYKEGLKSNMHDYTYEELILHQLNIIKKIVSTSLKDTYIVLDIPELTSVIYNELTDVDASMTFVFTRKCFELENINLMYFAEYKGYDCSNKNELYQLICEESGVLWTEEELSMNLKKVFNEVDCYETRFIKKLLKNQ